MTKEQVRLKAEEIIEYSMPHTIGYTTELLNAMLEFGLYIEELTKQRCLENATVTKEDIWLLGSGNIEPNSILNISNLCSNETQNIKETIQKVLIKYLR